VSIRPKISANNIFVRGSIQRTYLLFIKILVIKIKDECNDYITILIRKIVLKFGFLV
jgi:hypothetical protein